MKRKFIYALLLSFIFLACNDSTEKPELAKLPTEELITFVELTKEQFEAVNIQVGKVEKKNLKTIIKANGLLEVPPQNKAEVSSFFGAVVKSIAVLEGDKVIAGQTLATLEHPDFIKLQEEYVTAKENMEFLEKEFKRQKELSKQNAGTEKVYQKAQVDYNAGRIKYNSLEKQLKMLSINMEEIAQGNLATVILLKAPIDGFIGQINCNIGSFVEPNKTLFEIIDNSQIHSNLHVFEKDVFKVKKGQKIFLRLTNMPETQNGQYQKPIEGEIYSINKTFENNSKTISVHAKINNEKYELFPGMAVNCLIEVGENESEVVPIDAIVKTGGNEYVFIRNKFTGCLKHKLCAAHEYCAPSEDCPEHPDCEQHEHSPLKELCAMHKECEEHEKCVDINQVPKTDNNVVAQGKKQQEAFYFTMKEVVTGVSNAGFIEVKFIDDIAADINVVVKGAFFLLSKSKTSGQMDACGH